MTIDTAKDYLNSLLINSRTKSEIKIYEKFINVLTGLEQRELSANQLGSIEKKLTSLNLGHQTNNRKRHIRKKSNEFLKYLEKEFSIVLKGYYSTYGMSLGIVFGVAIGTAIFRDGGGSATGMCFGMLIGYIVGQYMDKEATKRNQVLVIA